jgi:hypothetical protein
MAPKTLDVTFVTLLGVFFSCFTAPTMTSPAATPSTLTSLATTA